MIWTSGDNSAKHILITNYPCGRHPLFTRKLCVISSIALILVSLYPHQAQAATADITFFRVTKQYAAPPSPPSYISDKVEWACNATWSTTGLQCHVDVSRWNPTNQQLGNALHHSNYEASPVSDSGNTTASPDFISYTQYRCYIVVWGPGTPSRIVYAEDTENQAPL